MKNRYIILYLSLVILLVIAFRVVDNYNNNSIEFQKKILLKQAQTHFKDQVNTRHWNSQYGGVYVKPIDGLTPNKYLSNNTLYVDEKLTLIKINPAWMTRQLSELSNTEGFEFKITSLNPLNPNNKVNEFEKRALVHIEKTNDKEYYEIDDSKFKYVGALITTSGCLNCHAKQGYKVGDIRGGISVNLVLDDYNEIISSIENKTLLMKLLIALFLLTITYLIYSQFNQNDRLQNKIDDRTKELENEKNYVNKILDRSPNIIIVTDGMDMKSANKRLLEFFEYDSLESFKKEHKCICDYILTIDDKNMSVDKKIDDEYWHEYIINHSEYLNKDESSHTVKLKKDDQIYYFILNAVILNRKDEMLMTFHNVTELHEKNDLLNKSEKMASLGEMLSNISHQWRQPLSVISTAASGMQLQKEYGMLEDKQFNEYCESIDRNAQYLSKTIDDFKHFIQGDSQKKIFNLNDDLKSFLQLVDSSIKNNKINIILNLQDDIVIDGYENELTQCFVNIYNNAVDALKNIEDDKRFVFIDSFQDDKNIIVKIRDNAGGIDKDVLPNIFEPYFTTKHKSQGTGLGLHMTYNLIVDGMEGSIEASNTTYLYENKEYKGAQFTITL